MKLQKDYAVNYTLTNGLINKDKVAILIGEEGGMTRIWNQTVFPFIERNSYIHKAIKSISNRKYVEFNNGSRVDFFDINFDALRGMRFDALVLIGNIPDKDINQVILPLLATFDQNRQTMLIETHD